jgi:GTP-binding protein Era
MTGEDRATRRHRAGTVTLAGWTNVGKSTLLNRLVGEKLAAVSPVSQTTRHRIMGVLHLEGRGQVVFADTPGLHEPRHRMNRAMVEVARQSLHDVDLVVLVVDSSLGPGQGDERAAALLRRLPGQRIAALNKIDLVPHKEKLLPMMKTLVDEWGLEEAVPVSAHTGEGCDLLVERILARLPEGPAIYPDDVLTDQPERLLAAEWIREKILLRTRQEIPHVTAVLVDRWQTRDDGLVEIEATILVERDSQKGIVIGKGGALLKAIGSEARADIERLLHARVYLGLHVHARPDWRDDDRTLQELGLG